MKTTADKARGKGMGWPRLLRSKSTGAVILATHKELLIGVGGITNLVGTVVHNDHTDGGMPVGHHSNSWRQDGFEPFHGVITIDTESSE